jgi:epoxide hydrolase-like predicted phosphatase
VFLLIKGIIFDIGGVIVEVRIKSFLEHFVKKTGFSKEQLYSMIMLGGEWEKFEKGLMKEEELKEKIEKEHGIKPELMEKMADDWRSTLRPVPETIDMVKKLKGRYKLFALSNVDEITTKQCFERFRFYNHFDGVLLSWKIHMRKPEPEIYEYTLKQMELRPEETVFIDNYPPNLPEARRMGIHTILYKNPGQLKKDLEKLGVSV